MENPEHQDSEIEVMEGVVSSEKINEQHVCNIVIANLSHLPKIIPRGEIICRMYTQVKCTDIPAVLSIQDKQPKLTSTSHVDQIRLDHIPHSVQNSYRNLLRQYADVFSKHDLDVGKCNTLPHVVRLNDESKVVSINQYRLPYHLKEVAIDYVEKLLKSGVVRESTSVFNTPLMLVKKPHADPSKPLGEQYRLVHNYVELNKNITPCSYPLRNLYELLDEVASGQIYSVLDLSQGFFQQTLIDPKEATSFSIPGYGKFTYTRSPQGLNSSPAYFQRMLDYVLKGIARCYVYIDDVVVSVKNHEDNLRVLEQVFRRFRKHNLKIKPSKCHIGSGRISYLGYDICKKFGISPGLAKTLTVKNFPEPVCVKDIRAFIGLTSFFRRAIKDYSLISAGLNKLVRKDSGYTRGPLPKTARDSFLLLKQALISRPCLAPVDFAKEFIVTTDASQSHYASCLSQIGSDGIERPCGYSSKLLSDKESRQQPGMRERAALLHALRHWQPYLLGKEFLLRTDHRPNISLTKGKIKCYDTLTDEILQFMPFRMEFLSGDKMFVDALSRPPASPSDIVAQISNSTDKGFLSAKSLDIGPLTTELVRKAQANDPMLRNILLAKRNILPHHSAHKLDPLVAQTHLFDGLLCSLNREKGRVVVLPTCLVPQLLKLAHDHAGHMSGPYLLHHLSRNWFWPSMHADVANFCRSCNVCSRIKSSLPIKSPLSPLTQPTREFGDRLHIDMLSMPKSSDGHVGILTAVDAATGFIFALPILDKTASQVVDFISTFLVPYFGCPKSVVTDLGSENINSEVKTLFDRLNISHVTSSRAHPQSNGMVERRQRMLIEFARSYTFDLAGQSSWHVRLPWCVSMINSTYSKSRKQSPYFLTFFRHPRLPYTSIINQPPAYSDSSISHKFSQIQKTLIDTEKLLSQKFDESKRYFGSNPSKITVGSKVFVRTSQRGKLDFKLAPKFKGPFICIRVHEHTVTLKPLAGGKLITEHKNNCKLAEWRNHWLHLDDSSAFSSPSKFSRTPRLPVIDPLANLHDDFQQDLRPIPADDFDPDTSSASDPETVGDAESDPDPGGDANVETGSDDPADEGLNAPAPPPPPPRTRARIRPEELEIPDPGSGHLRPETIARRRVREERDRLLREHGEDMSRLHLEAAARGDTIDPAGLTRSTESLRGRARGRGRGRGRGSL